MDQSECERRLFHPKSSTQNRGNELHSSSRGQERHPVMQYNAVRKRPSKGHSAHIPKKDLTLSCHCLCLWITKTIPNSGLFSCLISVCIENSSVRQLDSHPFFFFVVDRLSILGRVSSSRRFSMMLFYAFRSPDSSWLPSFSYYSALNSLPDALISRRKIPSTHSRFSALLRTPFFDPCFPSWSLFLQPLCVEEEESYVPASSCVLSHSLWSCQSVIQGCASTNLLTLRPCFHCLDFILLFVLSLS